MKRQQMCPNEACERYREPTGLMGGCECGTALVAWKPAEPTNQQLENLCAAFGIPVWPGWFDRNETMRQGALNLHRLVGKAATGDREANEALGRFLRLFGGRAAA